MRYGLLGTLICTLALSACNGSVTVGNDYYRDNPDVSLRAFELVDSYGVNTEFDNETPLYIAPFIQGGHFDVVWRVRGRDNYIVELFVNDYPTAKNGRRIFEEYCGYGLYCDSHPYQYCDFTPSLDMICESSSDIVQSNYIGDLLYKRSQDLFLVLRVCDTSLSYCESEALEVTIEH